MNNQVSFKNIMKFAGAYLACAIGSGFATGQEIMQFFTAQGMMSVFGTIVTTIIFAWAGGMLMKHGYEKQLETPEQIAKFYFGEKFGPAVEIILQAFLYGVYVIMIAGAGATISQYFGLNPVIGRVMMAVAAFITVILGLSKLTDILGKLGVLIITIALGIGIYSFLSNIGGLAESAKLIPTLDITKTQGGWLGSAILYPGFNGVVVLFLTCAMGKGARNSKEATWGGIIGGVLFGIAILFMNLGLFANISEIYTQAVPTLVLADKISPTLGLIFSVIICCGIYTTTVPMLWGVVRHFAEDGTKKAVLIALALTVLGLILGMSDFKVLVNTIYPISGYVGIILFCTVGWREVQLKHNTGRIHDAVPVRNKIH